MSSPQEELVDVPRPDWPVLRALVERWGEGAEELLERDPEVHPKEDEERRSRAVVVSVRDCVRLGLLALVGIGSELGRIREELAGECAGGEPVGARPWHGEEELASMLAAHRAGSVLPVQGTDAGDRLLARKILEGRG